MMNPNYKAYLKLLKRIAEIDADAALYLLTLSKKKKLEMSFCPYENLASLMEWDQTEQGFEYWENLEFALNG